MSARRCMTTTIQAATDALRTALADVDDNKVGAARALGRVAGQFSPPAPTSWEAFRHAAEQLLEPWFKAETRFRVRLSPDVTSMSLPVNESIPLLTALRVSVLASLAVRRSRR